MIGHPLVRAWYARHGAPEGRPPLGDKHVQRLLGLIAPGSSVTDLGGEDSLNLLVESSQLLLRIHKPFITRRRLEQGHRMRAALASQGLMVPSSVRRNGHSTFRCGPRWAELEQYLSVHWAPPGDATRRWLFNAIGRLHRGLSTVSAPLVRPMNRSWTTPSTLRRWLRANTLAGVQSLQDPRVVAELADLTPSAAAKVGSGCAASFAADSR